MCVCSASVDRTENTKMVKQREYSKTTQRNLTGEKMKKHVMRQRVPMGWHMCNIDTLWITHEWYEVFIHVTNIMRVMWWQHTFAAAVSWGNNCWSEPSQGNKLGCSSHWKRAVTNKIKWSKMTDCLIYSPNEISSNTSLAQSDYGHHQQTVVHIK